MIAIILTNLLSMYTSYLSISPMLLLARLGASFTAPFAFRLGTSAAVARFNIRIRFLGWFYISTGIPPSQGHYKVIITFVQVFVIDDDIEIAITSAVLDDGYGRIDHLVHLTLTIPEALLQSLFQDIHRRCSQEEELAVQVTFSVFVMCLEIT